MGGNVNKGTIGIAAFGHQRRQRALPAPPEQRFGQFRGVKIRGWLHQEFPAMLLQ